MTGGYYCMHRGWMDHALFDGQQYSEREAWCYLIEHASFVPSKLRYRNDVITVDRGEVPTSYRKLADKWKWSVNRVSRFLKLLQCERMISVKTDTGFLVISICNYEDYQKALRNADTVADTAADTQADTVADTNIKKGNNTQKGEEDIMSPPPAILVALETWNEVCGDVLPKAI